jgi:hypothetical protein
LAQRPFSANHSFAGLSLGHVYLFIMKVFSKDQIKVLISVFFC